tara:strand:+ start:56 stop:238 length:183 start_codon:yes stop_codon:yes gene_type:complete
MNNEHIYQYKGQDYEIIGESDIDTIRLINDFKYCESIGDYLTIDNRMTGGLMHGWIKKLV